MLYCSSVAAIIYVVQTNFKVDVLSGFHSYTDTHTRLTALFPGLPGWAGTRKVKPIWILLKQETVSGSGISWAICKFAPRSRQITTLAPYHSVFYWPDALPAAQPTASMHWRHLIAILVRYYIVKIFYDVIPEEILTREVFESGRLYICFFKTLSDSSFHKVDKR